MATEEDTKQWKKAFDLLQDAYAGKASALAQVESVLERGRAKQIASARLGQGESRNVNVSLAAKASLNKSPADLGWKHWAFVPYAIMAAGLPLWWLVYQIFQFAFVPGLACLYSAIFMVGAIVAGLIWRWKYPSGGASPKSKM